MSNSFDLDETPSYSSGSKLFAYGTVVVLGGLTVHHKWNSSFQILQIHHMGCNKNNQVALLFWGESGFSMVRIFSCSWILFIFLISLHEIKKKVWLWFFTVINIIFKLQANYRSSFYCLSLITGTVLDIFQIKRLRFETPFSPLIIIFDVICKN